MFGGRDEDTTKLQDKIIREYDMGVSDPKRIAANVDCSVSYARETLDEYRSGWDEDDDGFLF